MAQMRFGFRGLAKIRFYQKDQHSQPRISASCLIDGWTAEVQLTRSQYETLGSEDGTREVHIEGFQTQLEFGDKKRMEYTATSVELMPAKAPAPK